MILGPAENTFFVSLDWPVLSGTLAFGGPLWKPFRKNGCKLGDAEKDKIVCGSCPVTICRPDF